MLIAIYPEIIGSESFEQIESEVSIMETHIKVTFVLLVVVVAGLLAVNYFVIGKM